MKKIIINTQDYIHFINQQDILYCKSDDCYTNIHLINNDSFMVCKSLAMFSKELCSVVFIRVNQSYLINRNFVKFIDKKSKKIHLYNNMEISISLNFKEIMGIFKIQ
ncbi:LytR/AlgR family response regulator transcription factor [Pedobacter puniceum]|uniref:HTH LytTR-type domain-containing protein n=1 Tax=Pedobacter puniceum TaxID=2666136 RepID=A0A7K0FR89_9SPHI|nr:hypothetical protein [Pedobacter puniceum]